MADALLRSRGVFRVYQSTVSDGVWRFWRLHEDLDQRATATFSEDRKLLRLRTELNESGTWKPDLEMTYRRR